MRTEPLIVKAKDMDGLWYELNDTILWATKDELDYYSSLDTMIMDGFALTDSCRYSLNMGEQLWLTPTRWTTLINQYVNPHNLMLFLDQIKEIAMKGRGIVAMDFQSVKATVVDGSPKASRRKHGGCMRMLIYRNLPQPTLSLYSRTSYLGYIGGLDMMLAHKIAEQIGLVKGISVDDIRFRWHCEAWQFHGFKSLSYILTSTKQNSYALQCSEKKFEKHFGPVTDFPTWKLVRSWWKRILDKDKRGERYDEMKYGAEIRIRRRYHGWAGIKGFGPDDDKIRDSEPLSTPINKLTLDKVLFDRKNREEG